MRSFGVIWSGSFGSCIKGAEESATRVDSSVLLINHDQNDLGFLILIQSTPKERTFRLRLAMHKRFCLLLKAKIPFLPGVVRIYFWVARLSEFCSRKIFFLAFPQTENPPSLLRHHDFSNGPTLKSSLLPTTCPLLQARMRTLYPF